MTRSRKTSIVGKIERPKQKIGLRWITKTGQVVGRRISDKRKVVLGQIDEKKEKGHLYYVKGQNVYKVPMKNY